MKSRTLLCLRVVSGLLLAVMALAVAVPSLMAQSAGTGALTGTVTDPSGAVVPNATVTATNVATGQARSVTTGADGTYRFSLLPPGNYKVKFAASGFKTVEVPAITVAVTETPVLNRKLEIGAQGETVEVSAAGETIDTATSTLGTVVTTQTMTTLPLTSRNYTQILSLSSGTSGNVNNAAMLGKGTNDMAVNGNSSAGNNFQMDGVGINNFARSASSADDNIYGGIAIPNPDAIQEFKVQTSTYDASYGRNPGANVNVVTKSGTNSFHGTAFEFFRNEALNAKEYFSRTGLLNQNQFGGTVGGPIKKDKFFFFGSYQGTRQKNAIAPQGHYTANLTNINIPSGDRTSAAFINAVQAMAWGPLNPVALKLLQLKKGDGSYMMPSGNGIVSFVQPATYNEDQVMGNVDYVISSKHTLAGKYFWSRGVQFNPMMGGPIASVPGDPGYDRYSNDNALVKLTSLLSNTFTNEARISYQRMYANLNDTPPKGSDPASLGMVPITPGIQYPPLLFIGMGAGLNVFNSFSPVTSPVNQYQAGDQIAWSHGRHTIRSGFEAERVEHNLLYPGFERGWLWFLGMGDFLAGQPFMCIFCVAGPPNGVLHGYRLHNESAFVQDDWKVNSHLTLNLGVRWEFFGFPTDKYGNATNINPDLMAATPVPTAPGTSGPGLIGYVVPANYTTTGRAAPPAGVTMSSTNYSFGNPPKSNFAPRFGFAWQPTNSNKLVVRGGLGIFYDRVSEDGMIHGLEQGPPYSATIDYGPGSGHTLDNPFSSSFTLGQFPYRWLNMTCAPNGTNCTGGYSALNAPFISAKLHTPLVRQYNVNMQYEFAPKWVVEIGYVGSSGINLFDQYHDLNIPQSASPSHPINGQTANTIANIPLRVPVLGYQAGGLQVAAFDGISRYDSLQITTRKQFSHGLQMQASYTWSRSLTDLLPNPNQQEEYAANSNNPSDFDQQYGPSAFNRSQRLVVNYHYDLPLGKHDGAVGRIVDNWSIAGVTVVQNGTPLTIYDSAGGTIYGVNTSRAQLCPGVSPSQMASSGDIHTRVVNGYLNPKAFCAPPASGDGTDFGNSPVGAILGPGQFNWDFTINKDIKLTESKSFQFRTEFYNAFNHTQFGNPGNTLVPSLTRLGPGGPLAPVQGAITTTSVNPRLIQFGLKFLF